MFYGIIADIVVLIHLMFAIFAALGGLFIIWWRWVIGLHVPAFLWAVWIEIAGGICPLTHLENWLRIKAGQGGYEGDFVATYLLPLLYPADLTRNKQFILAISVIVINIAVYGFILHRRYRRLTK
jgi:hypothetical protein